MDEPIKHVRAIHMALIGMCAAIFIIVFSPQKSIIYKKAISELNNYITIDMQRLRTYLDKAVIDVIEKSGFPSAFNQVMINKGIKLEKWVDLSSPAVFRYKFEFPPTKSVHDLLFYFQTDHFIKVFLPDVKQLVDKLEREVPVEHGYVVSSLVFKPIHNSKRIGRLTIATRLENDQHKQSKPIIVDVNAQYIQIENLSFQDWFSSILTTDISSRIKNQSQVAFQNTTLVINEIGHKNVNHAIADLTTRERLAHQRLSFLGFSIDASSAMVVGPTLTMLILLYLIAHIKHLINIARENAEILNSFHWIGLFQGTLGRVLTYGSIVFIPVVANLLLLCRFLKIEQTISLWMHATIAIGLISCVSFISMELKRLRSLVTKLVQ